MVKDEQYAISKLDKLIGQLYREFDLIFLYTGEPEGLDLVQYEGPAIQIE